MLQTIRPLPWLLLSLCIVTVAHAETNSPWDRAKAESIDYAPQKVVYDVSVNSVDSLSRVLDRVSYLNKIYRAHPFNSSIVMVLHGNEIPFFAIDNMDKHRQLMERAQSLTVAGPIEFRMCKIAAMGHGLKPEDIHGFVRIVPMADAELIRLQREQGYAYMQ